MTRRNGEETARRDPDARRCRKCNHAARYYSPQRGHCAIVLPEGGGDGVTRYYCGCRCEWAAADGGGEMTDDEVRGWLTDEPLVDGMSTTERREFSEWCDFRDGMNIRAEMLRRLAAERKANAALRERLAAPRRMPWSELEQEAARQRQRADRAEAELARLREAVRGLCAILHADSPHDPSGEVEP